MVQVVQPTVVPRHVFEAFSDWRDHVVSRGILPIVAVTGSRGKSTVVHLIDAVARSSGLSTATRTNTAVRIRGKRQRGEIGPWSSALSELAAGTLDLAIEELDWHTLHAMGLEPSSHPMAVITNVCGNKDACLIQGEARLAIASLPNVFSAVAPDGLLIVNGDDFEVSGDEVVTHQRATVRVSLSRESPTLRGRLESGEDAAWFDSGTLKARRSGRTFDICDADGIPFTVHGRAGFQIQNALLASAACIELGLDPIDICSALRAFDGTAAGPVESFRVIEMDGVTVIVDRPNPSWFLRSVLRSLRGMKPNRVITVVGRMAAVPANDLQEVGRLVGRTSSHLVMHSEDEDPHRASAVRQGAALNTVPPVIVHTTTEGRALTRALEISKRGDVLLVLADRPAALARALTRSITRNQTRSSFPVAAT